MKPLSVAVGLLGILALMQPLIEKDVSGMLLGVILLLCAGVTLRIVPEPVEIGAAGAIG